MQFSQTNRVIINNIMICSVSGKLERAGGALRTKISFSVLLMRILWRVNTVRFIRNVIILGRKVATMKGKRLFKERRDCF